MLTVDKFSKVHSIGGKFYIYKLTNVNKPKEKNKTEIMNDVRNALLADKLNSPEFYSTIREIKNKIEDALASGTDIDRVVSDFKLEITDIKDYDKQKDEQRIKKLVSDDETRKEIIDAITTLNEKQASPIINLRDNENISYIVSVRDVVKETLPSIELIKEQVTKDYIADLKNKEVLNTLNELIGEAENPVAQIKTFPGAKSYTICKKDLLSNSDNQDLKKLQKDLPYPQVISEALSVLKQNRCKFYRLDANTYLVFGVENFQTPKYVSSTMKFMVKQFLGRSMNSDMYNIAKTEIKNRQKIVIHDERVSEATNSAKNYDGE